MTDDLLSRIWRNQFLTTVCSTFINHTCDAQMRTGIHLLNVVSLKYDHFFYISANMSNVCYMYMYILGMLHKLTYLHYSTYERMGIVY